MRFLCLHGSGTNSQVLETQLAALRHELSDYYTYEYVDGMIVDKIAPEIASVFPATGLYYSYFNDDPTTCRDAVTDLANYIQDEGPFDGVLAFSTGAALAATLLMHYPEAEHLNGLYQPPFKFAVFFSSLLPADPSLLMKQGVRKLVEDSDVPLIHIPTAHIWGKADQMWSDSSEKLVQLCTPHGRNVFVHTGSHEIPSSRDKSGVTGAAQAIQRTIDAALMIQ